MIYNGVCGKRKFYSLKRPNSARFEDFCAHFPVGRRMYQMGCMALCNVIIKTEQQRRKSCSFKLCTQGASYHWNLERPMAFCVWIKFVYKSLRTREKGNALWERNHYDLKNLRRLRGCGGHLISLGTSESHEASSQLSSLSVSSSAASSYLMGELFIWDF